LPTIRKLRGTGTSTYEWFEPEDIIRVQNQEWTRRYLNQIEKATSNKNVAKIEEMGQLFVRKLEEELRNIMDDKIRNLSKSKQTSSEKEVSLSTDSEKRLKEIANAKKIVELPKGEIRQKDGTIIQKEKVVRAKDEELEKEAIFKRKLRTLVMIAGLVLVLSPLVALALKILPPIFEIIAYSAVSLIVGAILLFVGIAPERTHALLEAKIDFSLHKRKEEEN